MKKIISIIFIVIILSVSKLVFAEEYNGFIFRVSEDKPVLFSMNENITYLGDGLYLAESQEDVYEFIPEDDIVTMFPNYTLELFENSYPNTTSDTLISSQWALNMICSSKSREKGVFGKGVKIAVIDSGLNVNHSDLDKSKIIDPYNCMSGVTDTSDVSDVKGHGTHVTGTIAAVCDNGNAVSGIAPESFICPLKVTDDSSFDLSVLYKAISKAIEFDCDIINMSFGAAISSKSAINEITSWVKKAINKGIVVVAAAGNYGSTELCYPAACDGVIGVGAINSSGLLWYKSQMNESVFVTAPGDGILSLSKSGSTERKSGTSMATPHVTAVVALIKQLRPESSIEYIKNVLAQTCVDKGNEGYDVSYGHGLINIESILNYMSSYIPPLTISKGMINSKPAIHIHNNAGSTNATAYFAAYSDNALSSVKAFPFSTLESGVTSIECMEGYTSFYLWDNTLKPYIKDN